MYVCSMYVCVGWGVQGAENEEFPVLLPFFADLTLSCGDANLVHDLEYSRCQCGHALRHEAEEVCVRLLVGEVKLETVLHLFMFFFFCWFEARAGERAIKQASNARERQNDTAKKENTKSISRRNKAVLPAARKIDPHLDYRSLHILRSYGGNFLL